ncbi:MAG: hypothetical protein PVI83_06275 [Lysobacterales bacterium]
MIEFKTSRGVSLVETIIFLALLVILASTAIPRFEKHGVRERVQAALEQASAARHVLTQTCRSNPEAMIRGIEEAGYIPPTARNKKGLEADMDLFADCENGNLTVVVWTSNAGDASDPVIEWRGRLARHAGDDGFGSQPRWDCRLLSGKFADVPAECRKYHRGS